MPYTPPRTPGATPLETASNPDSAPNSSSEAAVTANDQMQIETLFGQPPVATAVAAVATGVEPGAVASNPGVEEVGAGDVPGVESAYPENHGLHEPAPATPPPPVEELGPGMDFDNGVAEIEMLDESERTARLEAEKAEALRRERCEKNKLERARQAARLEKMRGLPDFQRNLEFLQEIPRWVHLLNDINDSLASFSSDTVFPLLPCPFGPKQVLPRLVPPIPGVELLSWELKKKREVATFDFAAQPFPDDLPEMPVGSNLADFVKTICQAHQCELPAGVLVDVGLSDSICLVPANDGVAGRDGFSLNAANFALQIASGSKGHRLLVFLTAGGVQVCDMDDSWRGEEGDWDHLAMSMTNWKGEPILEPKAFQATYVPADEIDGLLNDGDKETVADIYTSVVTVIELTYEKRDPERGAYKAEMERYEPPPGRRGTPASSMVTLGGARLLPAAAAPAPAPTDEMQTGIEEVDPSSVSTKSADKAGIKRFITGARVKRLLVQVLTPDYLRDCSCRSIDLLPEPWRAFLSVLQDANQGVGNPLAKAQVLWQLIQRLELMRDFEPISLRLTLSDWLAHLVSTKSDLQLIVQDTMLQLRYLEACLNRFFCSPGSSRLTMLTRADALLKTKTWLVFRVDYPMLKSSGAMRPAIQHKADALGVRLKWLPDDMLAVDVPSLAVFFNQRRAERLRPMLTSAFLSQLKLFALFEPCVNLFNMRAAVLLQLSIGVYSWFRFKFSPDQGLPFLLNPESAFALLVATWLEAAGCESQQFSLRDYAFVHSGLEHGGAVDCIADYPDQVVIDLTLSPGSEKALAAGLRGYFKDAGMEAVTCRWVDQQATHPTAAGRAREPMLRLQMPVAVLLGKPCYRAFCQFVSPKQAFNALPVLADDRQALLSRQLDALASWGAYLVSVSMPYVEADANIAALRRLPLREKFEALIRSLQTVKEELEGTGKVDANVCSKIESQLAALNHFVLANSASFQNLLYCGKNEEDDAAYFLMTVVFERAFLAETTVVGWPRWIKNRGRQLSGLSLWQLFTQAGHDVVRALRMHRLDCCPPTDAEAMAVMAVQSMLASVSVVAGTSPAEQEASVVNTYEVGLANTPLSPAEMHLHLRSPAASTPGAQGEPTVSQATANCPAESELPSGAGVAMAVEPPGEAEAEELEEERAIPLSAAQEAMEAFRAKEALKQARTEQAVSRAVLLASPAYEEIRAMIADFKRSVGAFRSLCLGEAFGIFWKEPYSPSFCFCPVPAGEPPEVITGHWNLESERDWGKSLARHIDLFSQPSPDIEPAMGELANLGELVREICHAHQLSLPDDAVMRDVPLKDELYLVPPNTFLETGNPASLGAVDFALLPSPRSSFTGRLVIFLTAETVQVCVLPKRDRVESDAAELQVAWNRFVGSMTTWDGKPIDKPTAHRAMPVAGEEMQRLLASGEFDTFAAAYTSGVTTLLVEYDEVPKERCLQERSTTAPTKGRRGAVLPDAAVIVPSDVPLLPGEAPEAVGIDEKEAPPPSVGLAGAELERKVRCIRAHRVLVQVATPELMNTCIAMGNKPSSFSPESDKPSLFPPEFLMRGSDEGSRRMRGYWVLGLQMRRRLELVHELDPFQLRLTVPGLFSTVIGPHYFTGDVRLQLVYLQYLLNLCFGLGEQAMLSIVEPDRSNPFASSWLRCRLDVSLAPVNDIGNVSADITNKAASLGIRVRVAHFVVLVDVPTLGDFLERAANHLRPHLTPALLTQLAPLVQLNPKVNLLAMRAAVILQLSQSVCSFLRVTHSTSACNRLLRDPELVFELLLATWFKQAGCDSKMLALQDYAFIDSAAGGHPQYPNLLSYPAGILIRLTSKQNLTRLGQLQTSLLRHLQSIGLGDVEVQCLPGTEGTNQLTVVLPLLTLLSEPCFLSMMKSSESYPSLSEWPTLAEPSSQARILRQLDFLMAWAAYLLTLSIPVNAGPEYPINPLALRFKEMLSKLTRQLRTLKEQLAGQDTDENGEAIALSLTQLLQFHSELEQFVRSNKGFFSNIMGGLSQGHLGTTQHLLEGYFLLSSGKGGKGTALNLGWPLLAASDEQLFGGSTAWDAFMQANRDMLQAVRFDCSMRFNSTSFAENNVRCASQVIARLCEGWVAGASTSVPEAVTAASTSASASASASKMGMGAGVNGARQQQEEKDKQEMKAFGDRLRMAFSAGKSSSKPSGGATASSGAAASKEEEQGALHLRLKPGRPS